jgi:hypothetical protein
MCIDAAVVTKETWLRTGRTPKESTGEFCYDQAGLELRLRESKDKAARTRELIAAGERHRAIAFGLVGLTVLGLGLTIGLTWPRRAVA